MHAVRRTETRYAWNGDAALAYQVVGDRGPDLVYLQGYVSNVDLNWEDRLLASFLTRLAGGARVIITDRRGVGCSERFTPGDVPPLEALVEDVTAVMDAAGSERAAIYGHAEAGVLAALFAASHPSRTTALILYGVSPTYRWSEEFSWQWTDERWEERFAELRGGWGDVSVVRERTRRGGWPIASDDEIAWWARYERLSATPGATVAESRRWSLADLRSVLPAIQVPTLVLHRTGDPLEPVEGSRYIAEHVRGAELVELPGVENFPWHGDQAGVVDAIHRFLAEVRGAEAEFDRVLATVLFTDIVRSTDRLAAIGDQAWKEVVERHHATLRRLLERYRGVEIDTAGDGFFATFAGPARAIRCAQAIIEASDRLGLAVRAGIHTGECELIDGKPGGVSVVVGARIASLAGAGEIRVSQTVTDLVAGLDIEFVDRGVHELKGLPQAMRIYAVGPAIERR
jgi:pimeloyl-ACP methyl ester carboxylesterase/class 3 adenylate cyclase